ncbi:MAG TPA: NADP-dependent oxidoreductase [Acidimicrobiales bacterium]|nr:NADP-dependent oxidoreductase [Acidimicrobiales bacterium]
MKAVRIHDRVGLDGLDGLVYEDAPDPVPAAGDVLVEVRACGITPNELEWPGTWVDRAGRPRTPTVPGHEVAGVVAALGWGTTGFSVGDEVFGLSDPFRDGAAAEYLAIEARNLALKPATVDFVGAAALPQAGLTAWQALCVHGRLNAGQTVLVHGAAGGVGSLAVQLARALGAKAIGTGRASARDLVLSLGAVRFVDLDAEPFESVVRGVDVVFDTIGGDILARSAAVVREGGVLVSIVSPPPTPDGIYFVREPDRAQLADLARRVDSGELHPQVTAVYPLPEAREAFLAKSTGSLPGKVILTP